MTREGLESLRVHAKECNFHRCLGKRSRGMVVSCVFNDFSDVVFYCGSFYISGEGG